jgi:hypothetical protein
MSVGIRDSFFQAREEGRIIVVIAEAGFDAEFYNVQLLRRRPVDHLRISCTVLMI